MLRFQVVTDTIAPAAPTNLKITTDGDDFIITWDAPTHNEPDASGYAAPLTQTQDFVGYVVQVYPTGSPDKMMEFKTGSTQITLTSIEQRLQFGSVVCSLSVVVYSRDFYGNWSQDPAEASIDGAAPAPFEIVDARPGNLSIIVEWEPSSSQDVKRYVIEQDGQRIVTVFPEEKNQAGNIEGALVDPGQGEKTIRVVAINKCGLETWSSNTVTASPGGIC